MGGPYLRRLNAWETVEKSLTFWDYHPKAWVLPICIAAVLCLCQTVVCSCCCWYKRRIRKERENDANLVRVAQEKHQELCDQREDLTAKLKEVQVQKAELKTEHDGVMQKIEAEQKKVEQLVDSELEQHHKLVQDRRAKFEHKQRARQDEQARKADDAQREVESQQKMLEDAMRTHATIKQRAQDLSRTCRDHEASITSLQAKLRALPDQQHYAAERAAWRGDEEALLAEKKALDEELSVAMRKVNESKSEMEEANARLMAENAELDQQVAALRRGDEARAELSKAEEASSARWAAELQELSEDLQRLQAQHESTKGALLEETARVQGLRGQIAVYETRLQTFASMRGMIAESHGMLASFQDSLEQERKEKAALQKSMEQEHMRTMLLMHILRQFKQKLLTLNPEAYTASEAAIFGDQWKGGGEYHPVGDGPR